MQKKANPEVATSMPTRLGRANRIYQCEKWVVRRQLSLKVTWLPSTSDVVSSCSKKIK